jgi:hypothetical protein
MHHPKTVLLVALCLISLAGPLGPALAQPAAKPAPALPANLSSTASGLQYVVTQHGSGAQPLPGQVVIAHYHGTLMDGQVFDSSVTRQQPFAFTLGRKQVIKGWDEGFALLHVGDKATLIIPPALAYGDKQRGRIPPNSTLRFDVELLDIKPRALADLLADALDAQGLEAGRQRFAALRAQQNFGDAYVSESQLNGLGYRYLTKERMPEALAVLQWAADLFPNSGNVYDSLGEAQRKAGLRDAALRSYEKSLALDPGNDNAKKVLAEMTAQAVGK